MKTFLLILSVLSAIGGAVILVRAESDNQQIGGFIVLLIAAVFLTGSCVVRVIRQLERSMVILQKTLDSVDLHPQTSTPPHARDTEPTQSDNRADSSDDASAKQLFVDAKQLVKAHQRQEAISLLKEIVQQFPSTRTAEKARRSLSKHGIET